MLEEIDLTRNRYSAQGVLTLIEPLRHANTQLTSLSVDWDEEYSDQGEMEGYLLLRYFIALNRAGRYCKLSFSSGDSRGDVPAGLWPHILEQSQRTLTMNDETKGIRCPDIVYDLLRGPALLDR